MKRHSANRPGLSLLEVLLATALLSMALAALAQLQSAGVRVAVGAQLNAEAALLCQAELDAWLARSGQSQANEQASGQLEPLALDPAWLRRIMIEPTATAGLRSVTVEIYRSGQSTSAPLATLTRWQATTSKPGGQP